MLISVISLTPGSTSRICDITGTLELIIVQYATYMNLMGRLKLFSQITLRMYSTVK